jgi:hypothetical protein
VEPPAFEDIKRRSRRKSFLKDALKGAEDLAGAAKTTANDAAVALAKPATKSAPPGPPVITGSGEVAPATGSAPPPALPLGDVASTVVVLGVFAVKGAEVMYGRANREVHKLIRRWRKGSDDD